MHSRCDTAAEAEMLPAQGRNRSRDACLKKSLLSTKASAGKQLLPLPGSQNCVRPPCGPTGSKLLSRPRG